MFIENNFKIQATKLLQYHSQFLGFASEFSNLFCHDIQI